MDENDKGKSAKSPVNKSEVCLLCPILLCPICFNLLKISDFEGANHAAKSQGLQVRCKCGNASLIKFGLKELHAKALALVEKVEALKTAETSPEKTEDAPPKKEK